MVARGPPTPPDASPLPAGEPLTYEGLRRVERAELRLPRLTRLEAAFWGRMNAHLAELRKAFADEREREPTSRRTVLLADELRNTERLASSIWEIRERKIVQEVLGSLRVPEKATPAVPPNLTPEERDLFDRLVAAFREVRARAVRWGGQPELASGSASPAAPPPARTAEARGAPGTGASASAPRLPSPPVATAGGAVPVAAAPGAPPSGSGLVLVRALEDIPPFAGPDLATYQFVKDEVGTVPEAAARLLARRGKVSVLPAG